MRWLCALGLASLALSGQAQAQAYQCRMPQTIAPLRVEPVGEPRRKPIGGHTLALSWSPEYCRGRETRASDALQCAGRNGRFGFVLHGLWPEAARGAPPQYCARRPAVSPALTRAQLCRTPSVSLIQHEWQKHGSCIAPDAGQYFASANRLFDGLRFPDMERLSRVPTLNIGMLRTALAQANPGLPPAAIAIRAGQNGWLREVHICLSRALRPTACPPARRGPPATTRLKIWRGL